MAGLLVVLTASLVAFPTIAVFNTLVAAGMGLRWLQTGERRGALVLGGLLVGAWGIAVASYYGVYLAELLTRTLPQILAAGPAGPGTAAPAPSTVHWRGPLDLLGWTFDYLVSPLPLLLGLAGLAAFWLRGRPPGPPAAARRERLLATLMAAWLLILPIFLLVNYRVDMIGKHLFYTMVPLALGSGLFLWRLTRRGGWGQVWAWLLAGTLATTALVFWIARLVQASS